MLYILYPKFSNPQNNIWLLFLSIENWVIPVAIFVNGYDRFPSLMYRLLIPDWSDK